MPKIWDETIAAHRERLRAQIIDAAMKLVAERGLMHVSMSAVARRAGIGRATLYNYFPDVEHMLAAHVVDEVTAFHEALAIELAAIASPGRRLEHYLDRIITYFASREHATSVEGTGAMAPDQNGEVIEAFLRLHVELREILAAGVRSRVFRRDLDPDLTAQLVNGLIGGTRTMLIQRRADPDEVRHAVLTLVTRGITPRPRARS